MLQNENPPSVQTATPAPMENQNSAAKSAAPNAAAPKLFAKLIPWAIVAVVAAVAVLAMRHATQREVAIDSQPSGATVFINGRLAGKTPLRVSGLDAGAYSLRFEREDCAPLTVPIVVGAGTTRLNETLPDRGTGTLKVSVEPAGAEVLLDGELVGHTPLDLSSVPSGSHDLLIRKTNFKTFTQRIVLDANATQEFKDFVLEDVILAMLQGAIDKDPQRVANYCDMGHYHFANNRIKEAADFYVRGLQVAGEPLTFPKDATPEERNIEQQLRGRDIERINDEIRKKMAYAGPHLPQKDVHDFIERIEKVQNDLANASPRDWKWVYEQARNFIEQRKFDKAESLYLRHIQAARGMETVAQAYINLITLRIHYMQRAPEALLAIKEFSETHYSNNPALARQAANAIYSNATGFPEQERNALLAQAEALLRRALANSPKRTEMSALCKFELGNVLALESRNEEAVPLYRDSVIETNEPSTKELRSKREVDTLKQLKRFDDAREILNLLAKSPRQDIAAWAASELKMLETLKPGTK